MFAHSISQVSGAMFPIIRITQSAPNQVTLGASGTGFFINSIGGFVTTAHIFDNPPANTKFIYPGLLPDQVINPQPEIQEITRDNANDIYVGQIKRKTPKYLRLSAKLSPVGRTVCIGGYPMPVITVNPQGGFDLGQVRRYYQPSFILDRATCNNVSQGIARTHEGYFIRDMGLFGMSGGPVFDTSGTVIGMQGSVTNPRESSNGTDKIVVRNAVVIRSDLILRLLKSQGVKID